MNKLRFQRQNPKKLESKSMLKLGDGNHVLEEDVVHFPINLRIGETNDGFVAKFVGGAAFSIALLYESWELLLLACTFTSIMFFGGHISSLSTKRRLKRIHGNQERFGLFLAQDYLAWKDLDQIIFIPHASIVWVEEALGTIQIDYQLISEKHTRRFSIDLDKLKGYTPQTIVSWVKDKPNRAQSVSKKQDMKDILEWMDFLKRVQIYQDWLPEKLLRKIPSLPCTQGEMAAFVVACKEYESNFKTRDWTMRSLIFGSTLLGALFAWLPLIGIVSGKEGWTMMSMLTTGGIALSCVLNWIGFEISKDSDKMVKHLFMVLLGAFFSAVFFT